jgi:cardiolipin synthase A/B
MKVYPQKSADEECAVPFATACSYPARAGNLLRPLIDGEPAFSRICEAIEQARRRVWVTVTFMWASFQLPGQRGTALDVLGRAAARGLDVRIIFWRPDKETEQWKQNAFWGSNDHFNLLENSGHRIRVRWDRAASGFCQHQKSWLIDAGEDTEIAFVGGINLNPNSMVAPGHYGEGQNHDVYMELAGPSVVDVHHNFAQRWNEASEQGLPAGRWGPGSDENLPFPVYLPAVRGEALVQIQRTIHSGRYSDSRPAPAARAYPICSGERSNLEQYCAAIRTARRSIYIEHQSITVDNITDELRRALERGVEVALVMPSEADDIPASLWAFKEFENFTLAGIAGLGRDGGRKPVWVHAKLMLVDGVWGTVGSCNLHHASLFGNAEMNVAFRHAETVTSLRVSLLSEHLGSETAHLDDRTALQLLREVAQENRRKLDAGIHDWKGLAFCL